MDSVAHSDCPWCDRSIPSLDIEFEFHIAVGQFVNYRFLLNKIEPNRKLYLAVPVETYETFFRRETVQEMVQAHCLKLAIYNPDMEVIEQWRE